MICNKVVVVFLLIEVMVLHLMVLQNMVAVIMLQETGVTYMMIMILFQLLWIWIITEFILLKMDNTQMVQVIGMKHLQVHHFQNASTYGFGSLLGIGTLSSATGKEEYVFAGGDKSTSAATTWEANYGEGFFGITAVASANADGNSQGIFEYAVPSGYYALNTKNLNTYG